MGEELVKQIEAAWERPQEDWARPRLLVVRLIAQHELTTEQIAATAPVLPLINAAMLPLPS